MSTQPASDSLPRSKTPRVTISNALVRSAHNLSIHEKRIVMLASTLMHAPAANEMAPLITLTARDYIEQYNLSDKHAYRDMKDACRTLMRKPPICIDRNGVRTEVHWTQRCDYHDAVAKVEIRFTDDIAPHVHGLTNHFTTYALARTSALRSVYSWRVFELLMQFRSTGVLKMPIDEFADAVEATPSHRKDFGAMRRRVIEPALKEIGAKDGLTVSFEPVRKGRKVVGVVFKFKPEAVSKTGVPATKPNVGGDRSKITKVHIEKHALPGETYADAAERLRRG